MAPDSSGKDMQLTAILIAPHRQIADQFSRTLPQTRAFQILADLKAYPTVQTLEMRLRQLKPDVVLLDLVSDPEVAGELTRLSASFRPAVHVVGLHLQNDSEAILRSLRNGASEFLYAPFEVATQREALSRIRRLVQPEPSAEPELGRVILFSSVKPGSGASTVAAQTAFAIKRLSGKRVLLADCDLTGGTIGFYLKLDAPYSLVDALQHADRLEPRLWSTLAAECGGVDILASPEHPYSRPVDPGRLHEVVEYTRTQYDWIVLDLPSIFHRTSLLALSECDHAFLVSTAELPSLHLARRAVNLLAHLGIERERYQLLVNRLDKRDGINLNDLEKMLSCHVRTGFPNDYFSLHRVVTLGQPLGEESELGRAVAALAGRLAGHNGADKRRAGALLEAKPLFSQT